MKRARQTLMLVAAIVCSTSMWAQSGNVVLDQINAIKAQTDTYYWEEYTHPDADTAVVRAGRWVLLHINANRSQELAYEDIRPLTKHINMNRTRGGQQLTRAFVYIEKNAVTGLTAQGNNTAPTVPTVAPSVPVVVPSPTPKEFVPDAFVQKIMQIGDFQSIIRYLRTLQADGQLLSWGKLSEVEDYSSLNLILLDIQSQRVITLFSPVISGTDRIDLTTGGKDSLDDYPEDMIAVIWYIK